MRKLKDSNLWVYVVFLGVAVLGIALWVVADLIGHPTLLHDLAGSLADALVIAVVLGITVERWVAFRFAREVGQSVFFAMTGRRAPKWYVDYLVKRIGGSLVANQCQWTITLMRADEGESFCTLEFRAEYRGENFHAREVRWPSPIWFLSSAKGASPSEITCFALEQRRANSRSWEPVTTLDGDTLAACQHWEPDGPVRLDLPKSVGVAAGAQFHSDLRARLTLRATDIFPIVVRLPTRTACIVVNGVGCREVEYRLQYQLREITGSDSQDGSYYHLDGVLEPGATVMLRLWARPTPSDVSQRCARSADVARKAGDSAGVSDSPVVQT